MKAAYFYEPGAIKYEDRSEQEIGSDEILIRSRAASICGTDLRIFKNGHFKIPAGTKRVLGHELAGEIVQIGSLVEQFKVGQRISVTPNIGCGTCEQCRNGYNQMCPEYEAFGISLDGGFQEYMRIPGFAIRGGNVFEIPEKLSFEEASLLEPLSCCFSAFKALNIGYEDRVLIIGPGPIGACFAMLSKAAGAKQVIVAGRRDGRLRAIEAFGADATINSAKLDLEKTVSGMTDGRGVDVVITAASAPELQTQAVRMLATHGRVCFFGGLPKGATVEIDTNLVHYKGLTLLGTTGSSNSDYYKSMQLVAEGRINLAGLVSERFELADINKAFEFAQSGQGMKSLIVNP